MFRVAEEVSEALEGGGAVVALESSIIAHGLPEPDNIETAVAIEAAVREAGATPATIALIDGKATVGLTRGEIERLADSGAEHPKAAALDLAALCANGATAGTTVSATSTIAARAGIRLFATGGIGGVHRGNSGDISSDLHALATIPIAVVSAGPKSILDLPRTVEALESLGVLTIGFRTSELPAFYSRSSGIALDHFVDTAAGAASVIANRFRWNQCGVLIANPIDYDDEIPAQELAPIVDAALSRAGELEIRGKALTPFLLAEVRQAIGAKAVTCNRALAINNARVAAEIAGELAAILPAR